MFAIASLALLAGCDTVPSYAPVIVSPAALRSALPELKQTGQSMVQDDHGQPHPIYGVLKIEYAPEPRANHVVTDLFTIERQCLPPTIPHPNCELDKHQVAPRVYVQNGTTQNPNWNSIGSWTLGIGVTGGVVGLEAYCFADCGTGGKIALASVDVVVVATGVVVIILLAEAFGRHGMN
jgi:hypothetical protein